MFSSEKVMFLTDQKLNAGDFFFLQEATLFIQFKSDIM